MSLMLPARVVLDLVPDKNLLPEAETHRMTILFDASFRPILPEVYQNGSPQGMSTERLHAHLQESTLPVSVKEQPQVFERLLKNRFISEVLKGREERVTHFSMTRIMGGSHWTTAFWREDSAPNRVNGATELNLHSPESPLFAGLFCRIEFRISSEHDHDFRIGLRACLQDPFYDYVIVEKEEISIEDHLKQSPDLEKLTFTKCLAYEIQDTCAVGIKTSVTPVVKPDLPFRVRRRNIFLSEKEFSPSQIIRHIFSPDRVLTIRGGLSASHKQKNTALTFDRTKEYKFSFPQFYSSDPNASKNSNSMNSVFLRNFSLLDVSLEATWVKTWTEDEVVCLAREGISFSLERPVGRKEIKESSVKLIERFDLNVNPAIVVHLQDEDIQTEPLFWVHVELKPLCEIEQRFAASLEKERQGRNFFFTKRGFLAVMSSVRQKSERQKVSLHTFGNFDQNQHEVFRLTFAENPEKKTYGFLVYYRISPKVGGEVVKMNSTVTKEVTLPNSVPYTVYHMYTQQPTQWLASLEGDGSNE